MYRDLPLSCPAFADDDNAAVDGACAIRRTMAGVAAFALGLGFIPALFGRERRAFHDRVAGTRVVALRSL